MSPGSLHRFFATSPAVHLLRSPNAAWILDFLFQQFKRSGEITQSHSALASQLEMHLTAVGIGLTNAGEQPADSEQRGREAMRLKAETYLATWCAGDCGWLKRFIDENQSEPVYQLTADSELVLTFVLKATRGSSAISTQSHLRSILNLLNEVAVGGDEAAVSPEPRLQIEQLQRQRADIDRQLERLREGAMQQLQGTRLGESCDKSTGTRLGESCDESSGSRLGGVGCKRNVDVALVREQFSLAVSQLEQLKSEFRAVEERFKSITRGVQQRLLAENQSRGEVLQFALDAEDVLKSGEHGRSFFEFLKLVHDPTSQEQIAELVQKLTHLEALAERHDELQILRTMIPTLLTEAEKILRTTQHLSHTLRRLLDSRSTRHHQQLAQVLRDIRAQASRLCQSPPNGISLEVEVEIDIQVPFDRPFWSQAEPFAEVELQLTESDPHEHALALKQLVALERIDWQTMRRNISRATQPGTEVTIAELLERFPIRTGTIDLLGYLQIAHEDGHQIDPSQTIELPTEWKGARGRVLRLPQVVFRTLSDRRVGTGDRGTGTQDSGTQDSGDHGSESRATMRFARAIDEIGNSEESQ